MIKIGTDVIEISRFSEMKNVERFVQKHFSDREREYFFTRKNPYPHIAGAFAAKEAFSKYLGSGICGFGLRDIEILHDNAGKPYICFNGRRISADLSISHSDIIATAVVCGEETTVRGSFCEYKELLPKRHSRMHKGDCGRVFIIAGSLGMTGAACLACKAAMRCGSGLVTLGTPECVQPVAASALLEVMTLPLPDRDGMICKDATKIITKKAFVSDVCAIGPGLGASDDIAEITEAVLRGTVPCVIDADGINAVAKKKDVLKSKSCDVVLTPHPGEMARLTGTSVEKIESDRSLAASEFAKEYNCTVVLKGHETVIAAPDGSVSINHTGNSGMASGGMGDVLTGVIASFIGQGCSPYDAAVLGVFIHGLAADIGAEKFGEFGLIAGDVIDCLPQAVLMLQNSD